MLKPKKPNRNTFLIDARSFDNDDLIYFKRKLKSVLKISKKRSYYSILNPKKHQKYQKHLDMKFNPLKDSGGFWIPQRSNNVRFYQI